MNMEFDPSTCPIGKVNEKSITHVGEKLNMAIERLEEKMDDMKSDLMTHMNTNFSNVNNKLDAMDERLTSLENGLDSKIDGEIKHFHNKMLMRVFAWIFGGLGAAVVISVVTKYVLRALNL